MSSDSDESSFEEQPHRQHLDNIWRNIQQTKHLSSIIDQQPKSHHKHRNHQQKSRMTEQEGRQYHQSLVHLLKQVRNLQVEKNKLRQQLEQEREEREQQKAIARKEYEDRLHAYMKKLKSAEKQNVSANKNQQTDQFLRENEKLSLRLKALELENRQLVDDTAKLTELNQVYLKQLSDSKIPNSSQVRGEQLLQLEQANQAICRLVELLRRTEQYRQFAPMLQQINNMHYLKGIIKRLKANQLNTKPIQKKVCSCRSMKINEKLVWSPVQCYKTMLQMKVKYDFLSEDCIQEVLFEMNRIYNAKEERTVQRLKQLHEQEINKVKKQLEQGYDQILTKKQIHRLKKQLRVAKSIQKYKAPPRLDQLKDKGQLEDQLKLKEREIRLLKERIKLFQTENGFQDKSLYYEGTLCALDKVLSELQNNEASLKQFQIRFREKVEDNMEPEEWLSSYKQFFQTLEELSAGLAQRILALKESILQKMSKGQ